MGEVKAVIFDLDGVLVATDEYHYRAWKRLADEEGIPFTRDINERCRGVSRMDSLEIMLQRAGREYTDEEKKELAERKNGYYRAFLRDLLGPDKILPGVPAVLGELKSRGVKVAVASSSKNAPMILERIGFARHFDACADGNDITRSKPDPQVFLLAAERLNVAPENCLVVEDAEAGIEAALAGGMKALGVGYAAGDRRAHLRAESLEAISVDEMLSC